MAKRRMFSSDIVDSDKFLDMSATSRLLYYDLGMRADDDGFVSPKKVMRLTGASEDDFRVLIAKNFIIPFESGVIVIKDWKMNNYIQKDRYTETIYKTEKAKLSCDNNNSYLLDTVGIQNVSKPYTQVRLDKVSIDNIYICSFETFWNLYPRKVGKKKVEPLYKKIATSKEIEESIMSGLKSYKEKWRAEKTDIKYIPNPTTWLNQARWEDDIQISNEQFNKNARKNEEEWKIQKEREREIYQNYKVDDGNGGMVKLSDLIK